MWNHEMKNAAGDPSMVTENCVQENLKNKGFVNYVYNNTRLMSNTSTISNEKIKRDPSNIFRHMHASDIAYTVMQRVNNEMVWKEEWGQKNKGRVRMGTIWAGKTGKKKAHKIGQKKPRGTQRGRKRKGKGSARKESKDKEDVVEVDGGQRGECTRRWAIRGTMAYGGDGLSAEGVTFYR